MPRTGWNPLKECGWLFQQPIPHVQKSRFGTDGPVEDRVASLTDVILWTAEIFYLAVRKKINGRKKSEKYCSSDFVKLENFVTRGVED